MEKINGYVYILGDDINTDDIVPSHTLTLRDPKEMAKYTLEFKDPEFVPNLKKNNIILAGENFGTGSSREEAVNVFKILGINAIIAKSFARIYFRNLINLGILPINLKWEDSMFSKDDQLEIHPKEGRIINITKNLEVFFEKLPPFLMRFIVKGGVLNYIQKDSR